jgi:hypothetical protein
MGQKPLGFGSIYVRPQFFWRKTLNLPFLFQFPVVSLHALKKALAQLQKRVISSVGLERCFDRAEVTGSSPVSLTNFILFLRDVAQPGSAHAWGAWSRRFKSCHPDTIMKELQIERFVAPFFVLVHSSLFFG